MKKLLLVVMSVILSAHAMAQTTEWPEAKKWKVGVSVGYTSNTYQMSTNYQYDWKQSRRGGISVGVSGQYDVFDWLGVRADLLWMQKNYKNSRQIITCEYNYTNDYLQLPVMASFSFGGSKLRGFANVGFYGGYYMESTAKVNVLNMLSDEMQNIKQSGLINSERDNRLVFGYVGGIGAEYRFAQHWAAQVEARYYWDATSQTKQYQQTKDHRYNTTVGLSATAMYIF